MKKNTVLRYLAIFLGTELFSKVAFAHPGHGLSNFNAGWFHPLQGFDHLIAALAIGIWAAHSDESLKKVDLRIPLGFIAAMTLGLLMGRLGLPLPFYELGIQFSIALLGASLVFQKSRTWANTFFVSAFGIFHGNAHGIEVGGSGLNISGFLGLIAATATLHALGIAFAVFLKNLTPEKQAAWTFRSIGFGLCCFAWIV